MNTATSPTESYASSISPPPQQLPHPPPTLTPSYITRNPLHHTQGGTSSLPKPTIKRFTLLQLPRVAAALQLNAAKLSFQTPANIPQHSRHNLHSEADLLPCQVVNFSSSEEEKKKPSLVVDEHHQEQGWHTATNTLQPTESLSSALPSTQLISTSEVQVQVQLCKETTSHHPPCEKYYPPFKHTLNHHHHHHVNDAVVNIVVYDGENGGSPPLTLLLQACAELRRQAPSPALRASATAHFITLCLKVRLCCVFTFHLFI